MHERLKAVMKEKEISANQLSFMSRIAASDLSAALRGKKEMFPNWKKRIAEALETDVESLFEEENAEV